MNELRSVTADQLKLLGNQGFALALRMLRHREDAADAVQDSMQQMFRHAARFDEKRGSLKSWFLTIVRHRCIDMKRKSRPVTGAEEFDPEDGKRQSPDKVFERDELVKVVRKALNELSEDSREIILLRDFHGLGYAEIAQVLEIASGTVMSRLHRARQQLGKIVKHLNS